MKRSPLRLFACFAYCLILGFFSAAEAPSADPLPEAQKHDHAARMAWWREARFGMFVHWGLYSAAEGSWKGKAYGSCATWLQSSAHIPAEDYAAALTPRFRPKPGFATEWARLAKQMGARYVVFTAKHHEGFALWNSSVSDFDAQDVVGRDLFREIIVALRAEGLRVGVYFSLIDWHHPDFKVFGTGLPHPLKAGQLADAPNPDIGRNWDRYIDFMQRQVAEVVSSYGPIDILWWDFSSKETQGEGWHANEIVSLVKKHQPEAIMNNRLYYSPNVSGDNLSIFDLRKGDFTTPEQHIPATGIPGVDWETCMTLNGSWGWKGGNDVSWKSTTVLVQQVVDAASKGGNYLLNMGPLPDGSIPEVTATRFRELGHWMNTYGQSIYGTTANPLTGVEWGRITAKSGRLFAHVFAWPKNQIITLPLADAKAAKAWMLADPAQRKLEVKAVDGGIQVTLDPAFLNPYASVVEIERGTP